MVVDIPLVGPGINPLHQTMGLFSVIFLLAGVVSFVFLVSWLLILLTKRKDKMKRVVLLNRIKIILMLIIIFFILYMVTLFIREKIPYLM